MSKATKNTRRYYLHRQLRKNESKLRLDARNKTIFIPSGESFESKYPQLLMDLSYTVQYFIL